MRETDEIKQFITLKRLTKKIYNIKKLIFSIYHIQSKLEEQENDLNFLI